MTIFVLSLYRFWRKSSHAEEVFVRKHHKYADWKVMDNPLAEVYERMGIGVQRAVTLAETYPTMNELCKATQKDIVNLKGFGKITAEKVLKFTRGRED
jgi:excinuclease UvrABC nuclease subunit